MACKELLDSMSHVMGERNFGPPEHSLPSRSALQVRNIGGSYREEGGSDGQASVIGMLFARDMAGSPHFLRVAMQGKPASGEVHGFERRCSRIVYRLGFFVVRTIAH
ncbi:MAG: hypothetical protein BGO65_10720 [Afipia sp. 64-13]|nr:MAG: hypothetical protein BGO65_10720 [Afipia sp. 64-13]